MTKPCRLCLHDAHYGEFCESCQGALNHLRNLSLALKHNGVENPWDRILELVEIGQKDAQR